MKNRRGRNPSSTPVLDPGAVGPFEISAAISEEEKAGRPVAPPVELTPASPPLTASEVKPNPKPKKSARSWKRPPGFARVERLLERVGRLPSADWQFVEMVFFRRMSAKQVARQFGMTEDEAVRRYRKILVRLAAPPGGYPSMYGPPSVEDDPAPSSAGS